MIEYRDLMAAAFADRGRDPDSGLDCYGLFKLVMQRFGHDVGEFTASCFDTAAINAAFGKEIRSGNWKPCDPEPGAAVVIAHDPMAPDIVQHFGVMLDRKRFIHIMEKTGVIISRITDSYYKQRIRGHYKWLK